VPFLAVYVLWSKRKQISQIPSQQCLWGLVIFVGAQLIRYFGLFFMYSSAQRLSLILSLASLALLMFGWKIFKKTLPIFIFLGLMLPLPRSVHNAIMLPLQDLATSSAVFCLETLGLAVIRQGNVIQINNAGIAVAEACNGLRMITSFFVIVGLIVLLINRRRWQKSILLLSALPIAVLCNTIRLTVTAVSFTVFNSTKSEEFFHTFGGYAMMPLALAIIVSELWIMKKLTQSPLQPEPKMIITNSRLV
jgi:exosortase